MLKTFSKQQGATLTELMISMTIGVTALSALAGLVGYGLGANAKLMASSRLNEELGNVMTLMVRDIKRAGYNGNTVALVTDPASSPSQFDSSLALGAYPAEAANSCLIFSYDNNANGIVDNVAGANENYGYRLRDGAIEMRQNGLACDVDGWTPLTDNSMTRVTALAFAIDQSTENGVVSSKVSISVEGELVSNSNFSRRFNSSFMVRNYD